jgi:hypothetical protein
VNADTIASQPFHGLGHVNGIPAKTVDLRHYQHITAFQPV